MVPKSFCIFCCTGQSGHTVIAHSIDAHPNAIIAEERKLFTRVVHRNWSLEKISREVEKSSKSMVDKYKTKSGSVFYGSWRYKLGCFTEWQGICSNPIVYGDKMGWDVLERFSLRRNDELLTRFERRTGIPLKIILVTRNPFDVIGSWYGGGKRYEKFRQDKDGIEKLIGRYSNIANKVEMVYASDKKRILHVRIEDFINKTEDSLNRICLFLELNPSQDYVDKVKKNLFPSPRLKRDNVVWTKDQISLAQNVINSYTHLKDYVYTS